MNIVGFVMVGTNDLEKSREFYDAVLVHLELRKVTITERYIGYGHSDDDLAVKFYIMPQLVMEQWLHYLLYQKML